MRRTKVQRYKGTKGRNKEQGTKKDIPQAQMNYRQQDHNLHHHQHRRDDYCLAQGVNYHLPEKAIL